MAKKERLLPIYSPDLPRKICVTLLFSKENTTPPYREPGYKSERRIGIGGIFLVGVLLFTSA